MRLWLFVVSVIVKRPIEFFKLYYYYLHQGPQCVYTCIRLQSYARYKLQPYARYKLQPYARYKLQSYARYKLQSYTRFKDPVAHVRVRWDFADLTGIWTLLRWWIVTGRVAGEHSPGDGEEENVGAGEDQRETDQGEYCYYSSAVIVLPIRVAHTVYVLGDSAKLVC